MFNATAKQYAEHWATLTGRAARNVYVPEALRELEPGQRVQITAGQFAGQFGLIDAIGHAGLLVNLERVAARTVVAKDTEGTRWKRC